jgi:hypothetical protein
LFTWGTGAQVFKPSAGPVVLPQLPDEFYRLTRDELLAEVHKRQRQYVWDCVFVCSSAAWCSPWAVNIALWMDGGR